MFKGLAKCVQRGRTNVSVHNSEGTEGKCSHADLGAVTTGMAVIGPVG